MGNFRDMNGLEIGNRRRFEVNYNTNSVALLTVIINNPPIAVDDTINIYEDTPITIAVLANDSDVDLDTLKIEKVDSIGTIGTLVIEPGDTMITCTSKVDFNGMDTFLYTVLDCYGGTSIGTVIIIVLPITAIEDEHGYTSPREMVLR